MDNSFKGIRRHHTEIITQKNEHGTVLHHPYIKDIQMDAKHYNELIELSQKIYDQATESLSNYLSTKYCGVGNDTMEQQLEDYLFITEETSAYFFGNALALLTPESQEKEIETFVSNLRRVIKHAQQKAGGDIKPS